jgi:hypothetical protein
MKYLLIGGVRLLLRQFIISERRIVAAFSAYQPFS